MSEADSDVTMGVMVTFRYSFVFSCHSFVIVLGFSFANKRMKKKIATERAQAPIVHPKILQPSPGGGCFRGP